MRIITIYVGMILVPVIEDRCRHEADERFQVAATGSSRPSPLGREGTRIETADDTCRATALIDAGPRHRSGAEGPTSPTMPWRSRISTTTGNRCRDGESRQPRRRVDVGRQVSICRHDECRRRDARSDLPTRQASTPGHEIRHRDGEFDTGAAGLDFVGTASPGAETARSGTETASSTPGGEIR